MKLICSTCKGRGTIPWFKVIEVPFYGLTVACPACGGLGFFWTTSTEVCHKAII